MSGQPIHVVSVGQRRLEMKINSLAWLAGSGGTTAGKNYLAATSPDLPAAVKGNSIMKPSFIAIQVGCLLAVVLGVSAVMAVHFDKGPQQSSQSDAKYQADALLENARNEVELLTAQLQVQKATVEESKVTVKGAEDYLMQLSLPMADGAIAPSRLESARAHLDTVKAQLKVKQAEQHVAEVRLKQAQGRLTRILAESRQDTDRDPQTQKQLAIVEGRMHSARRTYELIVEAWQKAGAASDEQQVYLWSRRWFEAERELAQNNKNKAAAIEAHLDRMKNLEMQAKKLHKAGQVPASAIPATEFYRFEAESWLVQARANATAVEQGHKHGDAAHEDWWCAEHGVPEELCSLCSEHKAKEFKAKGDWCDLHDRAKSQCFKCDPSQYRRFAAMYQAKYGKEPPRPPEEEFKK